MQTCTLTQTQARHHPTTQFLTDRMPFLLPNQQRQSTEGMKMGNRKDKILQLRHTKTSTSSETGFKGPWLTCSNTKIVGKLDTKLLQYSILPILFLLTTNYTHRKCTNRCHEFTVVKKIQKNTD